jgi:hypothetical protein
VTAALAALSGCASGPEACGVAACGLDRASLIRVTAAQLAAPAGEIALFDIHDYPGATTAWRARRGGRVYQCREARDAAEPERVKFVYCRPQT